MRNSLRAETQQKHSFWWWPDGHFWLTLLCQKTPTHHPPPSHSYYILFTIKGASMDSWSPAGTRALSSECCVIVTLIITVITDLSSETFSAIRDSMAHYEDGISMFCVLNIKNQFGSPSEQAAKPCQLHNFLSLNRISTGPIGGKIQYSFLSVLQQIDLLSARCCDH